MENPGLSAPLNKNNPNFRPNAGGNAVTRPHATPPSDGFFEAVDYIGGIGPNDNWIQGWTTSAAN